MTGEGERSGLKWRGIAALAVAGCLALSGALFAFSEGSRIEATERAIWEKRARSDAERLTTFIELTAERLAKEWALDARANFEPTWTGSASIDDAIEFMIPPEVAPSFAMLANPATARRETLVGAPFGADEATLAFGVSTPRETGIEYAVFEVKPIIASLMARAAPDGLAVHVVTDETVGADRGGIATFAASADFGGGIWRFRWHVLDTYEDGVHSGAGDIARVAGTIGALSLAAFVALLVWSNARISRAVDRRTAALAETRDRADAANRAKSEFLANMSHELRTPLNSIIGFSEVLESQMMGPEDWKRYREYSVDIRQSGRHLLALINDILDLSKAEAGHLILEESYVSVESLIDGAVRLVHERARNTGIELETECAPDLPLVLCDERRVRQILLNLLSNALKFTPKGGRIAVRGDVDSKGGITLTVSDTGIGMRPEDIPLALSKFKQLEGGDGPEDAGTGLGLPLAQNLARLHGGRLLLNSAPGRGTTATVVFREQRSARHEDVIRAGNSSD